MKINVKVKLVIDAIMTILFILVMGYHIFPNIVHEIIALSLITIFIIHNIFNYRWYLRLFKGKYSIQRIVQTIINLSLLVFMLLIFISALFISLSVFKFIELGNVSLGRSLHAVCTIWAFIISSIHLGMHMTMIKKIIFKKKIKTQIMLIIRVITILISGYGIYAFITRFLYQPMFNLVEFIFLPYGESFIIFLLDYLAILILFSTLGFYLNSFLSKIKGVKMKNITQTNKMEYVSLGKSNLKVSRICVGCMSFGDKNKGHHTWVLNQDETTAIVKKALELGINFFDTANCYSEGTSEIYLGNALKTLAVKRENVVIATKVYFNEGKLSREAILREVEMSLQRLQTTYIDLLIIHRFDYDTPIQETMEALNEVVKNGKVRYIGASAMYAHQFKEMQECARNNHLTEFISMQNHYNLLYREDEKELIKLLEEDGVSSTPYSPLAAGRLARDWEVDSKRSQEDLVAKEKYDSNKDDDYLIVKRVGDLSTKYNVSRSVIALSWLLSKKVVASVIIGSTKEKHLEEAVKSISFKLTEEDSKYLEEQYKPHRVVGALDKN